MELEAKALSSPSRLAAFSSCESSAMTVTQHLFGGRCNTSMSSQICPANSCCLSIDLSVGLKGRPWHFLRNTCVLRSSCTWYFEFSTPNCCACRRLRLAEVTTGHQMAPNRKKKKPASNPARGFATTSTASKPKILDTNKIEIKDGLELSEQAVDAEGEGGVRLQQAAATEPEKDLQDLTPEELESQLEDSSLQIIVESHSEQVKKDVSRQLSRLQTERRLLRSQAEHLNTRRWLPPEILVVVAEMIESQKSHIDAIVNESDNTHRTPEISEDDLLVRLWTLKCLLPQLGVSVQLTDAAIRNLLAKQRHPNLEVTPSNKDLIWGLSDCLEWLALVGTPENLPDFEPREDIGKGLDSVRRSDRFGPAGK